ncbi:MAG: haloacid dehalogenase-like hydrolase [Gemmataceae bacterium]|nr:haloacid dehalogenase-like hydrolase [Gemmataceae bacterium]
MRIYLFDIDGTLVSSGGAGKAAMEAALTEEFGVAIAEHGVPFSGRTDPSISRDLFRHFGVADTPENWQRFLATYLRLLPDLLKRNTGRVLPGIASLLEQLRARDNVWLGLLTGNVRDGARIKLSHFGLYHHFTFGGFGDVHHQRDDVAREALGAARSHVGEGVDLDRVWVIGDTPLDIRCARAIGAKVAAVATGWHSMEELAAAKPDILVRDFSDPAPLLHD